MKLIQSFFVFTLMAAVIGMATFASPEAFAQSGRSTNPTDNPDAWNCTMSDGSRSQTQYCRQVNYCLDSTAQQCSDKIGDAKYTPKGEWELVKCNKEGMVTCMRAVHRRKNGVSTNLTNAAKPWNCVMSNGKPAKPDYCRRVNYCLDTTTQACEQLYSAKKNSRNGDISKLLIHKCKDERMVTCLRAVN